MLSLQLVPPPRRPPRTSLPPSPSLLEPFSVMEEFLLPIVMLVPLLHGMKITSPILVVQLKMRSLLHLSFYLPLIEVHPPVEDGDDLLQDEPKDSHVDLLTPFHNSLKQIVRETSAVTIRRVLERLAVHYCSQRMAWKLLKDVSKSAKRKAKRGMPAYLFLFNISRTTFRGHALGVIASWIVQIIMTFYRYFIRKPDNDGENLNRAEKNRLFWREIYSSTIKFTSSLIFASIGGGIGALFHPSIGQWIGSALGDLAGPFIVIFVFEKLHLQI
ncbi:hypothetical protein M5K25_005767 [Dendrobium thyrsiflorum]|uniref:Uncharacterized protein n=1 Tax=Dendrobium thyrsiflorum TaxID=117978 RepID=A0ABD0VQZ7_DENTH